MNGAGFMLDAIKQLRGNRALLKKKDAFEIHKSNMYREKPISEYRRYRFKKASPEYLVKLRAQLNKERRTDLIKRIVILLLSISFGLILFL